MKNGDIIVVEKGFINSSNAVIGEVKARFLGIFSALKIFDLFE